MFSKTIGNKGFLKIGGLFWHFHNWLILASSYYVIKTRSHVQILTFTHIYHFSRTTCNIDCLKTQDHGPWVQLSFTYVNHLSKKHKIMGSTLFHICKPHLLNICHISKPRITRLEHNKTTFKILMLSHIFVMPYIVSP